MYQVCHLCQINLSEGAKSIKSITCVRVSIIPGDRRGAVNCTHERESAPQADAMNWALRAAPTKLERLSSGGMQIFVSDKLE